MIYRSEKDHCRRFLGPATAQLRGGPRRNFQVFGALDFLAELTQHVPEKGEHLVRYYGQYSHRQRGNRKNGLQAESGLISSPGPADAAQHYDHGKQTTPSSMAGTRETEIDRSALAAKKAAESRTQPGSVSTWARLIKRVYDVNPLRCSQFGGQMKIISFIERQQADVIEQILRHCNLWEGPIRTLATARGPPTGSEQVSDEPRELQLVLDPEYL